MTGTEGIEGIVGMLGEITGGAVVVVVACGFFGISGILKSAMLKEGFTGIAVEEEEEEGGMGAVLAAVVVVVVV